MGFLLRSAAANRISLHCLRELAGIESVRNLWSADARDLALVLDKPEPEMRELLVDKSKYLGNRAYRIGEQFLFRAELLRFGKPQICAVCVHRMGYCNAMWDCRLYTVCHLHRIPMVERCATCGQTLRWYRPAVDVCQCGAYFHPVSDQALSEDSPEVLVATWIANHFSDQWHQGSFDQRLPDWFSSLSLDGLCTLIWAFGVQSKEYQRVLKSSHAKEPNEFWRAVCVRSLPRIFEFAAGDKSTKLASVVWEGSVEGWALAPVCSADQQVALKLLRGIFQMEMTARFGSRRAALCQMHLFEE